jgi:hypothetical protein
MKEIKSTILYNDTPYDLVFDLNAMETIQDEYGTVGRWAELIDPEPGKEADIKALIFGFQAMLNEGIDMANDNDGGSRPFLSHKQVGRMISQIGMEQAGSKLQELMLRSTASEGDEKNE